MSAPIKIEKIESSIVSDHLHYIKNIAVYCNVVLMIFMLKYPTNPRFSI
jgi:hypothetical protein